MQYWLKTISSFFIFIILFGCSEETSKELTYEDNNSYEMNDSIKNEFTTDYLEPSPEEIQATIDELTEPEEIEPKVFIDSTNHKKFLTKNGYEINWNILSDVVMDLTFFPEHQASGYYAEFGTSPLFLREKDVAIEGYVIPFLVDTLKNEIIYVLSENPNSVCFFCGGSGPESVMELILKPGHRKYREDEYLSFKGNLVLNNGNPMRLNYLLYEAEELE